MIKEFNVKGMHCKSCEIIIKDDLLELKGINDVNVSSANSKVKVTFNENEINEKEIKKIIEKSGYKVK